MRASALLFTAASVACSSSDPALPGDAGSSFVDAGAVADATPAPDAATPSDSGITSDDAGSGEDSGWRFRPEITERVICTLPEVADGAQGEVQFDSGLLRVYARQPLSAAEKSELLAAAGAIGFLCEDEEPGRTSYYQVDMGGSATLAQRGQEARVIAGKPYVLAAAPAVRSLFGSHLPPETDDEADPTATRPPASVSEDHFALHGTQALAEYVGSYRSKGFNFEPILLGIMDDGVHVSSELGAVQDGMTWTNAANGPLVEDSGHGTSVAALMAAKSNGQRPDPSLPGNGLLGGLLGVEVELTAFTWRAMERRSGRVLVDEAQSTLRAIRDACGLWAVNHSWGLAAEDWFIVHGEDPEMYDAWAAHVTAIRDITNACPETIHVFAMGNAEGPVQNNSYNFDAQPQLRDDAYFGMPDPDLGRVPANQLAVQATKHHSEDTIWNQSVYAPVGAIGEEGTSFATPKVTATLALLKAVDPTLQGDALKDAVIRTGPKTEADTHPTFLDPASAFLVTSRQAGKQFSPLTLVSAEYQLPENDGPVVENPKWTMNRAADLLIIDREGADEYVVGEYSGRTRYRAKERFATSIGLVEAGGRDVPTLELRPTTAEHTYQGVFKWFGISLGGELLDTVVAVQGCFEVPGGGTRHLPLGRRSAISVDVENRISGVSGVISSHGRDVDSRLSSEQITLDSIPPPPCTDVVPRGLTDNTAELPAWIHEQETRTSTVCDDKGCTYELIGFEEAWRNAESWGYTSFTIDPFDCDWMEQVTNAPAAPEDEDRELADVNGAAARYFTSVITRSLEGGGPCTFTMRSTGRSTFTYEVVNLRNGESFQAVEVVSDGVTETWEWRTEDGVFPMSYFDGIRPAPRLRGPGLGSPGPTMELQWAPGLGPVGPAAALTPLHITKVDRTVGR